MKINNRFLSRLFAGFIAATIIATSIPVSANAEEVSVEKTTAIAEESEVAEIVAEEVTEETEVSDANDVTEKTDDTKKEDAVKETSKKEESEEHKDFFEEMTEAAQAALPLPSILSEQSLYGPAKIQWRNTETDPYIPNTTPGTIRYVTQNTGSSLFSYSYWGGHYSGDQCGTTCQTMALSYLGVNLTPGALLDLGGGWARIGTSYTTGINGGYDYQGYPGCNGTALKQAINNYLANKQSKPKYSPVFIHLNSYPYSGGGYGSHYVLIIGVIDESRNLYQTLDPWDNTVTEVTLSFGAYPTATYKAWTTTITADAVDEFYQFTNPKGSTGEITPVIPDPGPGTTPSVPSTPNEADTLVTVNNKEGIILADIVNARKEPVVDYTNLNVIGQVNKYDEVLIVGKTTNWYKCKFLINGKTKTGYIHKNYVGVGTRPMQMTFSLKTYYNKRIKISWKKQAGVSGYKIQRYDPATKKYKTIKTIANDSTTSYMDTGLTHAKSYKYRVYAYKTWVRDKEYTLLSVSSGVKSKTASNYMNAKTNGAPLNVRKGPGTNYGILKTLNRTGVDVRVYSLSGSWYKIKLPYKGVWTTAYVSKSYIKL